MVSSVNSVLCSAVLANSYIAVIPKSGILDESDNTRLSGTLELRKTRILVMHYLINSFSQPFLPFSICYGDVRKTHSLLSKNM